MDNLTAVATPHGLNVLKSTLKNTAIKYSLIGADTHNSQTTGTFYTANIETSFFDANGVLTFVIELPIATDFKKYLYAIAILDANNQIVVNTPTPKIALAKGIGGMVTIKAAVTGKAGEVIFKSSNYVTETELRDNWLPPIVAASKDRDTTLQNNINGLKAHSDTRDNQLQGLINALTQSSAQGDANLQGNINALRGHSDHRHNHLQNQMNHWAHIISNVALPPGFIMPWAGDTAPDWYLECNGAAISRTAYKRLFDRIGVRYGHGDGRTTFNLPDLRGLVVRGWDHGRGLDPNRALGSYQSDAIRNILGKVFGYTSSTHHGRSFSVASGVFSTTQHGTSHTNSPQAQNNSSAQNGGALEFNASRVVPTAAENRVKSLALMMCIKYN